MEYPVKLERDDNDAILVSFPDFPESHTYGDDVEDALTHAADALATVINAYIKDRRDIPLPSADRGETPGHCSGACRSEDPAVRDHARRQGRES